MGRSVNATGSRIPALLLYSKGNVSWQQCVADTLIDGIGLDLSKLPPRLHARLPYRLQATPYSSLSYIGDWVEAFQGSPRLQAQLCNVCDLAALAHWLRRLREFPLIFVMHSANGDGLGFLMRLCNQLRKRAGLLVVFVANEYNHLGAKRAFIRDAEADFAATQLPSAAAEWLYADCGRARPLSAFAALNVRAFPAPPSNVARRTDLVFRGSQYALALGDDERTRAVVGVQEEGKRAHLQVDIAFTRTKSSEWAQMLAESNGIPGAESGTYFLERDSSTYHRAEAYERLHPETDLAEMRTKFYSSGVWPVSGKMLSSRHLEPMGTKTCQLLVEGEYNGVLKPDEHFIPLTKDLSNVREAVEKFRDASYRQRLVDTAYDLAMSQLTFERRVEQVLADIGV